MVIFLFCETYIIEKYNASPWQPRGQKDHSTIFTLKRFLETCILQQDKGVLQRFSWKITLIEPAARL